jgi:nucleoside-diphosphate-sugar epimerase
VFGSTGPTGRLIVTQLLDTAAFRVRAVARTPTALDTLDLGGGADADAKRGRLEIVKGDLLSKQLTAQNVAGTDAVVFCAGVPSIAHARKHKTVVYSIGAEHVLDAMHAAGVKT